MSQDVQVLAVSNCPVVGRYVLASSTVTEPSASFCGLGRLGYAARHHGGTRKTVGSLAPSGQAMG
jgi:hypothetical protein